MWSLPQTSWQENTGRNDVWVKSLSMSMIWHWDCTILITVPNLYWILRFILWAMHKETYIPPFEVLNEPHNTIPANHRTGLIVLFMAFGRQLTYPERLTFI